MSSGIKTDIISNMLIKFIYGIASFLVAGLGQIIKGGASNNKKGLLILLYFYFVIPIFLYLTFAFGNTYLFLAFLGLAVILLPALWVFSIIDAIK